MFDSMLAIKVSSQLAGQMTIEAELHNTSIEVLHHHLSSAVEKTF